MSKPFFRFSLDESSLHNFFSTVKERLSHYDSLFAEQNNKIFTLNAQLNLQSNKEQLVQKLQSEISNLSNQIKSIETSANNNSKDIQSLSNEMHQLKPYFESKINEITQLFEKKLSEKNNHDQNQLSDLSNQLSAHIEQLISESVTPITEKINLINDDITKINQKHGQIAKEIDQNAQEIGDAKKIIETIKNSFLSLNPDKNDLPHAASFVNDQFNSIFSSLKEMKKSLNVLNSRPQEPDLSSLQFHPIESECNFSQPPELPPLYKFRKISDSVNYIYELVPYLQSYLNAIYYQNQETIRKEADDNEKKKEKDKEIVELRYEIANIKSLMTNLATREDVNIIARGRSTRTVFTPCEGSYDKAMKNSIAPSTGLNQSNLPSNGGFGNSGAMKCIACGRELPNNNGYGGYTTSHVSASASVTFSDDCMTEFNGNGNNYLSLNGPAPPPKRIATAVNGSRKFNVGIVENPRSSRSYRNTQTWKKIQTPATVYKP